MRTINIKWNGKIKLASGISTKKKMKYQKKTTFKFDGSRELLSSPTLKM